MSGYSRPSYPRWQPWRRSLSTRVRPRTARPADIERNLVEASPALLGVVRPEAVAKQPPLVHHPDVVMDADLAVLTRTGFREAVDDDVAVQVSCDNGIELLVNDKPDQALAVMEQTLADRPEVDPALLGALELNLSAAALQVGDAEKAQGYAQQDNPFEYWAYKNDNKWPPSGINPSLSW